MILKNSLAYMDDGERMRLRMLLEEFGHAHDTISERAKQAKVIQTHYFYRYQELSEALDKDLASGPPTKERIHRAQAAMIALGDAAKEMYEYLAFERLVYFEYIDSVAQIQANLRPFMQAIEGKYDTNTMSYQEHFSTFKDRRKLNVPYEKIYEAIQEFLKEDLDSERSERPGLQKAIMARVGEIEHQYILMAGQLGEMATAPRAELQARFTQSLKEMNQMENVFVTDMSRGMDETHYVVSDYQQKYGNYFQSTLNDVGGKKGWAI